MNRELCRGWSGWHEAWADIAARRAALRRGLSHVLQRGLSRGWDTWVEMAAERAEAMQKLRQGVSYLVRRELAVGFTVWVDTAAPHEKPMSKALLYFTSSELSRSFVPVSGVELWVFSAELGYCFTILRGWVHTLFLGSWLFCGG